MSTTFNNVYDDLRTILSTVLSGRTELNNPYFIEDDSDIMFDNAWTVSVGAAQNTDRFVCGKATMRREFILTLANRYFAPSRDISARITAEKTIVNAQLDVIKYIEASPQTVNILQMRYEGDNGLEFLEGDRFGFLILQSTITVEYLENL
jgi:hypothetical protein